MQMLVYTGEALQFPVVTTCVCLTLQLCVCVPEAGDGAVHQEAGQHGGLGVFREGLTLHVGPQH